MCYCSLTTFSVLPRQDLRCPRLLGRMPSAVGYQPTLQTEMGALQERITSTKNGSITSVQAVYVPADDLTDPAPANDICPSGCHYRTGSFHRGTWYLSGGRSAGSLHPVCWIQESLVKSIIK